jgi:hypothetical protein
MSMLKKNMVKNFDKKVYYVVDFYEQMDYDVKEFVRRENIKRNLYEISFWYLLQRFVLNFLSGLVELITNIGIINVLVVLLLSYLFFFKNINIVIPGLVLYMFMLGIYRKKRLEKEAKEKKEKERQILLKNSKMKAKKEAQNQNKNNTK